MLLEERIARLEAEVRHIVGVLQGTHDLNGNPLPEPPRVNPRDPEAIRELRRRVGIAAAHAAKPVGTGRGKVRTEKQHQAFLSKARKLEKKLEELELQFAERRPTPTADPSPRIPQKRPNARKVGG